MIRIVQNLKNELKRDKVDVRGSFGGALQEPKCGGNGRVTDRTWPMTMGWRQESMNTV